MVATTPDGASMRDVLGSSGPVGRDLLEVDWAAIPLGDPDTWSSSLRSAVRTMLTSRFAMWMAWGEDLTFLCNDAYRRDTLGTKYPWALGRPAHEVWSEIWGDIGPRIDRVTTTGEATWDERLLLLLERSGYVEETYHTFSYSPLADDDGAVTGMLCVVAEVTDEVIAERRMHTLRDLGVRVSTARDEREAVTAACDHLADNPLSLPFVAVYLFEDGGPRASLVGTAGIPDGHPAFPPTLTPDEGSWSTPAVLAGRTDQVDDLAARVGPLPTGAWDRPPHQAIVVPLTAPDGNSYGFLVVGANPYCLVDDTYRDFVDLVGAHLAAAVTDARALADQRERAERLAALDQAKSDFLANVSHELRTPLTLLLGPAEDALADVEATLPPVQRARVELVARNGDRMLRLVNSLLDFSRLQAGEDVGVFVPTELGAHTAELVAMFETAADRAGISLEVRHEPVEVYVDREHWAKIVVNLVSNAVKFTFEGGIVVDVRAEDGHAVLRVSDTGTGVPAEELPLLFDRFHRVAGARSRSHEGSGIGLALVEQLAQAHGGEVAVSSTVGVGSTFTVRLPLGRDHLPAERVSGTGSDPAGADRRRDRDLARSVATWELAAGVGPEPSRPEVPDGPDPSVERAADTSVLVVDDNADMRGYVAGLLEAGGYRVRVAEDGVAALEQMRAGSTDLVLTDVMMPRLDGFGLVRAIRADPVLASVPVVMLSARAGEEGTLTGLESGADDYLVKPFSARELLARVRTRLALDRSEKVRRALERNQQLLDQAQRLARVGSWEIDLDADTITASDAFVDMLGLTHADLPLLGTSAVMQRLVHPDDLDRVTARLGGLAPGEQVSYETRIVLPSGEERLFTARGERLPDEGRPARVLRGSFQDITDQRRVQDQLVAAEALARVAAREHAIADELQRSLLPPDRLEVEALDVATFYQAAGDGAQVGGDWYDVIDLGAGRAALVVGDVMGRGVRAAATTGQLRSAVRALVRLELTPSEILEHLDAMVQELAPEQIVTCVLGVVDVDDLSFTYAGAGHLPVVLTGPDGARLLRGSGPPLGAGFYGVESSRVDVRPDDVLTFYTDGLVERRDSDLLEDIDRLAAELGVLRDRAVDDQVRSVVASARRRGAGEDDVAVLVARVRRTDDDGVLRRRLAHDVRAPAEARAAARAHLRAHDLPATVAGDVVLAVSELVTNAVVHSRPPVSLRVRCTDHSVLVEVEDRSLLRPRQQRPDERDEGGRGLQIVAGVSTSWGTRRSGLGKVVWCSFEW
jgi:PAS domain S-box-containing protein